ncbi:hypothetical protein BDN72DRAFT_873088 [Pluteus cervinus]|uniref:Uncharacterized protein n=1 Tax=Pluteus cervinus TaxID=181527 RepID=A0ACD2ZZT7_9AGAR|nr:hypothetical protein BDN72DRAFT_873088 [Pluteus cervinus]
MLQVIYRDGSSFRASDSFVRKWLHDSLHWSIRKETRAAQKLPENWEDQSLMVGSDQTGIVYCPGGSLTWADTGAKQVAVVGKEEKRAFTALVSISWSGVMLPVQAIYAGKTDRTETYWSNFHTMKLFKSLWMIDLYAPHRSEEFREWMNKKHPTIILDYVPGGCIPTMRCRDSTALQAFS